MRWVQGRTNSTPERRLVRREQRYIPSTKKTALKREAKITVTCKVGHDLNADSYQSTSASVLSANAHNNENCAELKNVRTLVFENEMPVIHGTGIYCSEAQPVVCAVQSDGNSTWRTCIVRPGFPTNNHDLNLSNAVKLFEPPLFLQRIAGSDEKYNRKESSNECLRSARRLPKICGKLSPAKYAALYHVTLFSIVQIGRAIEHLVVVAH